MYVSNAWLIEYNGGQNVNRRIFSSRDDPDLKEVFTPKASAKLGDVLFQKKSRAGGELEMHTKLVEYFGKR